jgi:DNA-binding IclR family transcriptional regulator
MSAKTALRHNRQPSGAASSRGKALSLAEPNTGTVSRALSLLSTLADAGGPVTVKEVADKMGLPPSTAHRLLQLMRAEGFVAALPGSRQYIVGNELYRVSARIVNATKMPDLAQRFIENIASHFDETVVFGLYLPAQRALCFISRADGKQILKYQIDMNKPLSLVWGASGKAILAFLPDKTVVEILAAEGPSPAEGRPTPSPDELRQILLVIRSRGYAVTESEKLPGARGIAAPVFGPDGVMGCICLTSPKARMPHGSIEEIGRMIASTARDMSLALGAP